MALAEAVAATRIDATPRRSRRRSRDLTAAFGNRVVTSQAVREQHGNTLTWIANQPPDAVVFPQIDRGRAGRSCASARRIGVPVIPFGVGTSLEGHVNAPLGGVSIDLRDMNRVLAVHAEDLDCVVEPGITRKPLNEHLRDQGLFFPIDPGADASLGGMAATRCSGTNAVRYGTMKDNVLALKVVMADGELMTTARRAKKSSAGYDLTRLIVGSEGTLGVITELTLKLSGIPEAISAGVCPFPSVEAACKAAILTIQSGIPVARIELLDALQVKAVNGYSKLDAAGGADAVPRIPRQRRRRRRAVGALRRDRRRARRRAVRLGDQAGGPHPALAGAPRRLLGGASRCARARRLSRPTSACRSRGSPNASPQPAARHRRAQAGGADRRPCRRRQFPSRAAGRHERRRRGRARRGARRSGWSSGRSPWTEPAPASTASARAR